MSARGDRRERRRGDVRGELGRLGREGLAQPVRAPAAGPDAVERVGAGRAVPRHQPPASRTSRWRTRAATARR